MRDTYQRTEARAKRSYDFISECDFRHHHDDVAPRRESARGQLQVDLGLATAGHAMEQETLVAFLLDRACNGFDRGLLLRSKFIWR